MELVYLCLTLITFFALYRINRARYEVVIRVCAQAPSSGQFSELLFKLIGIEATLLLLTCGLIVGRMSRPPGSTSAYVIGYIILIHLVISSKFWLTNRGTLARISEQESNLFDDIQEGCNA